MRVLIVEDDTEKLKAISQALGDVEGFDVNSVEDARNIAAAKSLLKQTIYDLLILDIAVPMTRDQSVHREAGLHLLNDIFDREEYKVPAHIIGITGYTDIHVQASQKFSKRSLQMLLYTPEEDGWMDPLQAQVKHILLAKESLDTEIPEYKSDLAIVCALKDPELLFIRRLNWNWKQLTVPGDDTIYYQGICKAKHGERIVYAAACARMGMPAAGALAMKMIFHFRPRYIVMPGIAAAVAGRAKFGDVMVAEVCWDWGSGKLKVEGEEPDKKIVFEGAPHQLSIQPTLRKSVDLLKERHDILGEIKRTWHGEAPDHELKVHSGPMASGAAVLADGVTIQRIRGQHRELLGIEMETFAVYQAAEESSEPRPLAFSMKSVVDFADGEKDDKYRKYASHTSAQVIGAFVEEYL